MCTTSALHTGLSHAPPRAQDVTRKCRRGRFATAASGVNVSPGVTMRVGSSVLACCCLLLQLLGLALFLRGFFPVPVRSQSRKNSVSDIPSEPSAGAKSNWTALPSPLFKKTVIFLIDAFRQDFVFGPKGKMHMPYMTEMVEKGTTHSFIAKATAPTVTMPRIKALTTGSIPGFIDIIMNLNSQELLDDNLIWQAKQAGRRIVFYGDDTWIRLFPKHFVEHDGTTSFFVSDFTEVDYNVTRHLDNVLSRNDWDILILHYLGLDHIGHLTGPHSHLVGPKLFEMDNVLKKIHTSLMVKEEDGSLPSLIVVCGDHGMSETGSHGGSSDEEIETPLLLISSSFERKGEPAKAPDILQQTDLAPTLAIGLGLPIPRNSLGTLIHPVIEQKTMREQLRYFHLNGYQLSTLLRENVESSEKDVGFEQFKKAEKSHGNWIKLYLEGNTSEVLTNLGRKVLKQYIEALMKLSSSLSKQVAEYDMYSMTVGAIITLEILFLLLLSVPNALCSRAEFEVPLSSPFFSLLFYLLCLVLAAIHVIVCTSTENVCFFCSISWVMAIGIMTLMSALCCIILSTFGKMLSNAKSPNKRPDSVSLWSELDVILLMGTLGHVLSMGASSFIEEEHQTWYFLVNTLCLALAQNMCRKYFLVKKGNPIDLATHKRTDNEGAYIKEIYDMHKKEMREERLPILSRFVKDHEKWIALSSPWAILICCRLLRSLNQTGVQWIHRPDFGHWLTSSEHKAELSFLVAVSLVMIFILIQGRCSFVSKVALAFGLLGVYSYRAAIGHVLYPWQQSTKEISKGITEARFVYIFVLGILITGIKDLIKSQVIITDSKAKSVGLWEVYCGLVLLAALLFRPHNLAVLVFCLLIQSTLTMFIWKILKYDAAQVTLMHYWFGQAFFFFQVVNGSDLYHLQHNGVQRKSLNPHHGRHIQLKNEPKMENKLVLWFEQQTEKRRFKRQINVVPTDPLFFKQWYLNNDVSPDFDVMTAWSHGYTGRGVVVSILDDGLEKDHPDLSVNYDPLASYDFNSNDPDPQPRYDPSDENRHGTRCAGEVAAVANNGVCGAGIAFNAGIGGVRMLDGAVTDIVEAKSLSLNPQHIHIYSASWGPEDDGKTVEGPGVLATQAFYQGIVNGRGGLGSIFVWAAGNGGLHYDNCNCDGYSNNIYTISVGSATENGNVPWYSESCASTLTTTFSSGTKKERQIVTTDLHHKCTDQHTGTSASAPFAAGIIALALEANPTLTWRDLQHLVMRASSPGNLKADDWMNNGVGRKVSHHYGYGLLDAGRLVGLAQKWESTHPQRKCLVEIVNNPQEVRSYLLVRQIITACVNSANHILSLEHVQAKISLSYSRRGDLEIFLTSPMGTRSVLVAMRPYDTSTEGYRGWSFMSTHMWDENPHGLWTLELVNKGQYNQNDCGTSFYSYGKLCLSYCPPKYFKTTTRLITSEPDNSRFALVCAPCHPSCYTCNGEFANNCTACSPFSTFNDQENTCSQLYFPRPDLSPSAPPNIFNIVAISAIVIGTFVLLLFIYVCCSWCGSRVNVNRHIHQEGHLPPEVELQIVNTLGR
uniref:P/Homo B domain-containing protein n=1 Tax=Leptobrachium leishanense TaxID=445787 RepID=A0A8C5LYY2_9ANUR